MLRSTPFRSPAIALLALLATSQAAPAQTFRPQGSIPDGGYEQTQSSDAASLTVRMDRLENQVRSLTGQNEQLQFQVKRLEESLRKFQQDVDFRFEEKGGRTGSTPGVPPRAPASGTAPQRRSELNENGYPIVGSGAQVADNEPSVIDAPPEVEPAPPLRGRRGDAFDPTAMPNAPGAPLPLGSPQSAAPPPVRTARAGLSGPLDDGDAIDPNAPLDLMRRTPQTPARPADDQGLGFRPGAGAPASSVASLAPASPRDEFDAAATALKAGQYSDAEAGFSTFLQKHPKDRLVPDVIYNLGESYYRRARPREAAEQYLKLSTDYERSPLAPPALVKLGLSLEKLGAKEQACAAYGEVGRKYPNASQSTRASAERESKRAQC